MTRPFFVILIFALLQTAHSQSSSPKPQPPKTVQHPSWTTSIEQNYGIHPQEFYDMGLGTLTMDQYEKLFTWINTREQKVRNSVPQKLFICGRPAQPLEDAKPEGYDKVRVYVSASGDSDDVISGVRQRLRAMDGTEVVYNRDEADLEVHLITTKTETKAGHSLGVAVSLAVTQPCIVERGGKQTVHYDVYQHMWGMVDSDVSRLADDIVSAVDTHDFEDQRKANADFAKFLRDSFKK